MIISLLALLIQASSPQQTALPDGNCADYEGNIDKMGDCFGTQTQFWEDRLRIEYMAAVKRAEVNRRILQKSQQLWIKYRESNCAAYDSVDGSIHTILAGNCLIRMTKERARELHEMTWVG